MRFFPAVLLAVSLINSVRANPPTEMPAGDVSRWLTFFDTLVDTVVGNGETCDKLATEVNAVIDKNLDVVTLARNARAAGKKLPEAAQHHMLDGAKRMVPTLDKCGEQDNVRAAFARLDLRKR
jgi:hypothetical protein